MGTTRSTSPFERFIRQKTVALTTFRRDGTGVSTPINIVVDGDHAYFRTPHVTGMAKRLRNNPNVELAPSTIRDADRSRHARQGTAALRFGDHESSSGTSP
jgi:PPOX class probable F420-dependent enzyme